MTFFPGSKVELEPAGAGDPRGLLGLLCVGVHCLRCSRWTGPGKGGCWGEQLTTGSFQRPAGSRARGARLWAPRISPNPLPCEQDFFFFFCCIVGGSSPQTRIEPEVPALNMQSLNHWTAPTLRLPDDHLTSWMSFTAVWLHLSVS